MKNSPFSAAGLLKTTALPLLAAGALSSCYFSFNCGLQANCKETRMVTISHETGNPLRVKSNNGSIKVVQGGGDKVEIKANIRAISEDRLLGIEVYSQRLADGTLSVSMIWPEDGRKGPEGCSLEITIPDASKVDLDTNNGRIRLAGLAGDAKIRTSNGSITIKGHDGPVHAVTNNGAIKMEELTGQVHAHTSNGAIRISGTNGPLDLRTSNGAVSLKVGADFNTPLSLTTSNGGIHLPPANANFRVTSKKKKHAEINQDAAGERSRVQTSNGSVTVSFQ